MVYALLILELVTLGFSVDWYLPVLDSALLRCFVGCGLRFYELVLLWWVLLFGFIVVCWFHVGELLDACFDFVFGIATWRPVVCCWVGWLCVGGFAGLGVLWCLGGCACGWFGLCF